MPGDGIREDGHLVVFQGRTREVYAHQSDCFVAKRALERVFFGLQRRTCTCSDPRSIATFGHHVMEVAHQAITRSAKLVQFVPPEPWNTVSCAGVRITSAPVEF